jgi:hypothetical protein
MQIFIAIAKLIKWYLSYNEEIDLILHHSLTLNNKKTCSIMEILKLWKI